MLTLRRFLSVLHIVRAKVRFMPMVYPGQWLVCLRQCSARRVIRRLGKWAAWDIVISKAAEVRPIHLFIQCSTTYPSYYTWVLLCCMLSTNGDLDKLAKTCNWGCFSPHSLFRIIISCSTVSSANIILSCYWFHYFCKFCRLSCLIVTPCATMFINITLSL